MRLVLAADGDNRDVIREGARASGAVDAVGAGWRTFVLVVALVAIAVGCLARFDGLDRRLFWQDEAFSMMRITGHVEGDLYRLFDDRVHDGGELFALQRLDPSRGFDATVTSLNEEPQRGPLFYVIARMWSGVFGDGVWRMRALSASIGIVGIGFAFLLGRRIAGGNVGGAILAALVAVSPIEVRFSGQLREYAAIATATLACNWLLLRALDRPSVLRSAAYAFASIIGLFISPIFGAVVSAHVAFGLVTARRRATFLAWGTPVVITATIFLPWLLNSMKTMGAHSGDLAWLYGPYPFASLLSKWLFNIGAVFFDSELANHRLYVILLPVYLLVAWAFGSAFRRDDTMVRSRTLGLLTTLVPVAGLVAYDVLRHAHYEAVTRYLMSAWIGIDMLVAMLLARLIGGKRPPMRAVGAAGLIFLIACGTESALISQKYDSWWDDNEHLDERSVARAIVTANATRSIVAGSADAASRSLVLSRYLPSGARMLLYGETLPAIPTRGETVFLFVPRPSVLVRLRARAGSGKIRNVSPPRDVALPDLGTSTEGTNADPAHAGNALWEVVGPISRLDHVPPPFVVSERVSLVGGVLRRRAPRAASRSRRCVDHRSSRRVAEDVVLCDQPRL